jgi:hypothetical protein
LAAYRTCAKLEEAPLGPSPSPNRDNGAIRLPAEIVWAMIIRVRGARPGKVLS